MRKSYAHWIKTQRKYRKAQRKLQALTSQGSGERFVLIRKLDILRRRLQALNSKWRLGIAASVLTAWLATSSAGTAYAQLPAAIQANDLNSYNGLIINGLASNDRMGYSVGRAGDINGDGIDDMIIGDENADPNGKAQAGATYIIFGTASGVEADLASLDGSNGFTINGANTNDFFGGSVSAAGDVNGDGIDDVIVGATSADPGGNSAAGSSYVIFGSASGFPAALELSALDGSNGFTINGISNFDGLGYSVSGAGDVNGDGLDDVIVGAPRVNVGFTADAGASYVIFGRDTGFSATLSVSSLDGSNGFVINGINNFDLAGYSVSGAGDVNGDGIDDVIIGATEQGSGGMSGTGSAYVVFGRNTAFSASIDLSSLDGAMGFVITGTNADDKLGVAVSAAGDVNGDGIDDVIIGADSADPGGKSNAGSTYVIFGKNSGFAASLAVSTLDGSNGFTLNGLGSFDNLGRSVSAAGDFNGDGMDDLVIGASGADPNGNYNIGAAYVILGSNSGFDATFDLSSLDGTNGLGINGLAGSSSFGFSVSGAGDMNADGSDDLIIGSPSALNDGAGKSFIVYGIGPTLRQDKAIEPLKALEDNLFEYVIPSKLVVSSSETVAGYHATLASGDPLPEWLTLTGNTFSGTPPNQAVGTLELTLAITGTLGTEISIPFSIQIADAQTSPPQISASDLNGLNGFLVNGINDLGRTGYSVDGVGDVNGDGIDDVIIGAPGEGSAGSTYVIFGNNSGFASAIELSTLDGTNGFVISGVNEHDGLGASAANAGDVNGDGLDDMILGAPSIGKSYIIFGSNAGFPSLLEVSSLDGTNGFAINGASANDRFGVSVSEAGDINGDGFDDVIIGADNVSSNGLVFNGASYVFFGENTAFPATLEVSTLDGTNGFTMNGLSDFGLLGGSVSGAGDVNGDGIDDVIIGAYYASSNGLYYNGSSYIVFGKSTGFASELDLSTLDGSNGFRVDGLNDDDELGGAVSSAGDVNGDGIEDMIVGAIGANSNSGSAYVVFGKNTGFAATLAPSSLDGTNGFAINGLESGDRFGSAVGGAGDVNGDGMDDVVVGARYAEDAYVIFGSNAPFAATLDLSSLNGSNGWLFDGGGVGQAVGGAGDINGDGVEDLILGAKDAAPDGLLKTGSTYVIFGILPAVAPTLANPIADQQVNEDELFEFTIPTNTFEDRNQNDIQTLSATLAGGGALPSWLTFDPTVGTFSGTPTEESDIGVFSIEVTNTDEDGLSATDQFDLEVVSVNDAPVLAAIGNHDGDEGTNVTFTATATDTDLPANTLTFSLDVTSSGKGMTIDGSTGAFSWTPSEDQGGSHEVTVTVSDGELTDSETIIITVNEVNSAPVLAALGNISVNEGAVLAFTATASDEDLPAQTLTFSIDEAAIAKGMTINAETGVFTWTPGEAQDGSHEVMVTVSDGELTDSETITITVNEVNSAPVLSAIGNKSVDEGVELTFTATVSDADLPAQTLTFSIDEAAIAKGMTINGATGAFSWKPGEAQDGSYEVTVTVSDGELVDSETLLITVNEVNQAPALIAENQTVDEGSELIFSALATDQDVPQQMLTFEVDDASVARGLSIESATGKISWTPGEAQDGTHDVMITTSDGVVSVSKTITITVNEVNSAPVLAAIGNRSVNEGTELSFTATTTDSDIPSQTLTYSLDDLSVASGMQVGSSTGEFSWTPSAGQAGDYFVTLAISDGVVAVSETFTITVSSNVENRAPVVAEPIADQSVTEGFSSLQIDLATVFVDEDGDQLTISAESANEGVATILISGQTLTISEVGTGATTVTVTAGDGGGGSVSDSFDVEVLPASVAGVGGDANLLMAIYPNPTEGMLSVNVTGSLKGVLTAGVHDLSGQQLSQATVTGNSERLTAELDLTGLAPGVYLLSISLDGKPIATRRIIKK